MTRVNIAEAKARMPELIRRALAGDEVVIARDNKPLVRLVPVDTAERTRTPGTAKGLVRIGPDFDAPLGDFEEYR